MKKILIFIFSVYTNSLISQDYYIYVAAESEDEVSLIKFDGTHAYEKEKIQVGIMKTEIEGPHGITVDPNGEYLSEKGFKRYLSSLRDQSMSIWNEVKKSIEEYNPSVIGISAKTQNFISATIVAKIAKEINPSIKVIVGGVHPTMNGSKVLDCKNIDFLCIAEGENTIV